MQTLLPIDADITKIIGQYLSLQESRKVLKGRCPFHADSGFSLMVYPIRNHFKCFGCGEEGSAEDFMRKMEKLPKSA